MTNPRQYYEKLLSGMPAGLERAVLSILRFHIGGQNAIEKEPLILTLTNGGFPIKDERQVRLAIVRLRKAGLPVCSSSADAGYFLPVNRQEFQDFLQREYWKKITDMAETARAMTAAIPGIFPGCPTAAEPCPQSFDGSTDWLDIPQPAPEPIQGTLW